jgi:arsenite/tail-anchored protein-transporting ATPase
MRAYCGNDMVISETEKFVNNLKEYGINVGQIVMNNVVPLNESCEFCREKRKVQKGYINYLKEKMSNVRMTVTPLQQREVKGLKALESFKELLFI